MRLVNFRLITQKYIEHSWAFLFLTHLCYTFLINIVKQRMKFFGLFCRRTLHLDGRRSNSRLSIILSFLFWFINGAIYQLVSLLSANNTAPFCYTCIHLYSFHTATDFSPNCDKFFCSYLTLKPGMTNFSLFILSTNVIQCRENGVFSKIILIFSCKTFHLSIVVGDTNEIWLTRSYYSVRGNFTRWKSVRERYRLL